MNSPLISPMMSTASMISKVDKDDRRSQLLRTLVNSPSYADDHTSTRNLDRMQARFNKVNKMANQLLNAQTKANDMTLKIELCKHFKETFNLALSYKVVQALDTTDLEYAFYSALLDKRIHIASLTIAACWKGLRIRRHLRDALKKRKWAITFI